VIWVLRDPLRFAEERREIEALEAASPWLTITNWRLLPGGDVGVEFDIDLGHAVFDGRMSYPQSFPSIPPSVRPRTEVRWSRLHQWGAAGELCLEHGPDNWTPATTGADMIASTHRLLVAEVREIETTEPVPTRHTVTTGQALRSDARRLIATATLEARLADTVGHFPATFSIRYRTGGWLAILVTLDGEDEWIDSGIPQPLADAGVMVRGWVSAVPSKPTGLTGSSEALRTCVLGASAAEDAEDEVILCRTPNGDLHAAYLLNKSDIAVELAVVPAEPRVRLDAGHAALASRSVGLVGCGSLGSKIAASLVLSGVGRFVLVDDDVLRPGNLVRHELDWGSVGRHKADALAERLKLVNPAVVAEPRRHRLGGQEANGALDGAVTQLAGCDLIIDATANGRAFNYAAAAAAEGGRTMVWAEVFGGGFGGLVARSRPGLEPDPQMCRARIEQWCRDQNAEPPRAGADYDGTRGDVTMIADDAAVATMAAHAVSMALDALLQRDDSRFPHGAYMVGMAQEWIFGQPFEVHPIDLGEPASVANPDFDDAAITAALADLSKLLGT
jgi:molybdopterin/thiamine biosynthesis adenylyltransferase